MKTRVLRKMGYEGSFIYILQFGHHFQYLFAWENEVYRDEIVMKPEWKRRIGYAFGLLMPFTREQLETAEQVLMSGAMLSIDTMKERGTRRRMEREKEKFAEVAERAKRGDLKEELEREREKRYNKECMWQARKTKDEEGIYLCLTHNKTVPIEQNVAPKHES